MGTQANVLTPQQMRCIYALARGGGISNDDLHAVVFTTTGKDSIRLLTTADAKQVIDRLKRLTGQETTAPHNRPTKFRRVPPHLPGRQARTQLHRSDEGHAGRRTRRAERRPRWRSGRTG